MIFRGLGVQVTEPSVETFQRGDSICISLLSRIIQSLNIRQLFLRPAPPSQSISQVLLPLQTVDGTDGIGLALGLLNTHEAFQKPRLIRLGTLLARHPGSCRLIVGGRKPGARDDVSFATEKLHAVGSDEVVVLVVSESRDFG